MNPTPSTAQSLSIEDSIKKFLESVLDKADIYTRAEEQALRARYVKRMSGLLQERIGLAYMQALYDRDPKLVQKMDQLAGKGDSRTLAEFIQRELPQAAEITNKVMLQFGEQLLHDVSKK